MQFKESRISRLYLSLWKQEPGNLQNLWTRAEQETRWNIFFFFFLNISFQQLLESERLRLWLWLLLLKITAWHLLNQSVSVLHTQFPSTWKLSPTLAFWNVLSLRQILLWESINKKKSDSTEIHKKKNCVFKPHLITEIAQRLPSKNQDLKYIKCSKKINN